PFSSSIPVELTSFTAKYLNDEVVLNWQTATETNNSGFEIERSQKSKVKNQMDWTQISFVEGRGTTTEITNYMDKITEPGKYTYRLKQIDFDGSSTYSQVVEVNISSPIDFVLYQNYPNPFNPTTTIKFALPIESKVKINVYNSLGQLVETLVDKEMESGYHEVNFNASRLASGVYLYQLQAQDYVSVKKMLLIK
ncbi:MAG: T9SS type A sorting domain-containing protein, partial [Ignavibacteriaceae bacterium]|nr:T9SS type A sorting domain-containing protein [Ignavibacteriaceae bacterium]